MCIINRKQKSSDQKQSIQRKMKECIILAVFRILTHTSISEEWTLLYLCFANWPQDAAIMPDHTVQILNHQHTLRIVKMHASFIRL